MDVLSHFGGLDELIQVIYQGFDRFVVVSKVNDHAWTIYLGLKGPEGRWWRGSWSARDITQLVGSKPSSQVLENFANKLTETFVNGELSVGDWTPDEGAQINLTLGSTSKKPLYVPLVELSPKEAASHATTLLTDIALQAQSRKCRLNPPVFSATAATVSGPSNTSSAPVHSPPKKKARVPPPAAPEPVDDEAQLKIKKLEAELAQAKAKKTKSKSPSGEPESKPSVSVRPPKGASLANPHKKARKYQAVEFESDEE